MLRPSARRITESIFKAIKCWQKIFNTLGIPTIELDRIIPGAQSIPVTLIDYQYVYGNTPLHELVTLCKIVRYRQPKFIFEIGTYLGETTLQLTANSQAEIYTLDLPQGNRHVHTDDVYPKQPGIRFQNSQYNSRIHQLFGNSQTYDFTPFYGKMDFVFIDGCHHYKCVLSDSNNALKIISRNGIIVWHDYVSYIPGVPKVLNKLAKVVPLVHIAGTSLVITANREVS